MPVDWPLLPAIRLGGVGVGVFRIDPADADRQRVTAEAVLRDLRDRPGVVLADEVGMGKTYVALAVAASVVAASKGDRSPVVVMVPSRLRRKWQREWEQFKRHCTPPGPLDRVRCAYAHTPTEFFRHFDAGGKPCHLVFMTTGCFTLGLQDPWIKLAFIRLARRHTRLTRGHKNRIYRWAVRLVRQATVRNLTDEVIGRLLSRRLSDWKSILVENGVLTEGDADPVPDLLVRYEGRARHPFDWGPLCEFLRTGLPTRKSGNIRQRLKDARQQFTEICRTLYEGWLSDVPWKSPLLILDEAHHAKNDTTRLARLFREPEEQDIALLRGKFRRMLFLTATPFQLGHHELIRVLRTFGAVRWVGQRAPLGLREDFDAAVARLTEALDANRLAGRHLDRLWGAVTPEAVGEPDVAAWWQRVEAAPSEPWEQRLVDAVRQCRETRAAAEGLLRPWVIRHNRSPEFPPRASEGCLPRRETRGGRAILDPSGDATSDAGLPIARSAALPFLLAARAQGELAYQSGARAFFAEGLASSYEAFHDTRKNRGNARDVDDEGYTPDVADADGRRVYVPTEWYEERVAAAVPSREGGRLERLAHPKVNATVHRAVDLWMGGEKVLVFCVYRETARALYEHLKEEVDEAVVARAAERMGLDPAKGRGAIEARLERIARRLSDPAHPLNVEVREILSRPFEEDGFATLRGVREQLVSVLAAYFRAPSFIARYLPLDAASGEADDGGRDALRRAILETQDRSGQTIAGRVRQFLEYAVELSERARTAGEGEAEDEAADPLRELLDAVAVFARPRARAEVDRDDVPDDRPARDGTYRVVPLVRMVYGETAPGVRDRLALAFNSPLFPEILVSSAVMGEGIDLHRFCRHVIHHDGFWNPSTLEQQTGRLDRIRSKAEVCRRPIQVYQPFIAGSADEKMYRVLRDRERWFQVVMGQKFEFDEASSEEVVRRVLLPERLAAELTFDLTRWRPNPL